MKIFKFRFSYLAEWFRERGDDSWSFSAKMMIITVLMAANISYTFSSCDSFMGCSIYTFLLLNKSNNLTLEYI